MNRLRINKSCVILPLISVLFLIFASCGRNYFSIEGQCWGTFYHIVYAGDAVFEDSVKAELAAIDSEFSLFNPASVVSRVNSCELDSVGPRFIEVFSISGRVSAISDGVYDPTIGPVADIWGFGRTEVDAEPSDSMVASALRSVGIADCRVSENGIVAKKDSLTRFDFSSVAKGYGIDCIADMFERNGITDYMIEIGGEVLVGGLNPKGAPWRIQVDSPEGGFGHSSLTVVELGPERTALATSGDYRNFRTDSNGERYGHTLSPVTGRPVRGNVLSATVMTSSCAEADALATACMASGDATRAMRILQRAGAEGFVVASLSDSLIIKGTAYFMAE